MTSIDDEKCPNLINFFVFDRDRYFPEDEVIVIHFFSSKGFIFNYEIISGIQKYYLLLPTRDFKGQSNERCW